MAITVHVIGRFVIDGLGIVHDRFADTRCLAAVDLRPGDLAIADTLADADAAGATRCPWCIKR